MNQNYSWGSDMQTSIQDFAKEGGYEVVESTLHDVNRIQDFSPYASKIKASGAQTVITGNWSNDLLRSEEHTSELQSLMRISYAVFCLKKKKTKINHNISYDKSSDHTK